MDTQKEITKIYTYNRNGRKQTVKRVYKIKGEKKAKRAHLEYYFDHDYNNNLITKENYRVYNATAEYPISYSMFFTTYKQMNPLTVLFGPSNFRSQKVPLILSDSSL